MRILTLLKQSRYRRRLVLEAGRSLLRAWWLVRFREFRCYAGELGEPHPGAFLSEALHGDISFLRDVRWAIDALNRTAGGRFTCLMQAMAGKAILNRHGVANTLILGAKLKRGEDGLDGDAMAAHAWLRAGPVVLLGGEASVGFVPVTSYHSN